MASSDPSTTIHIGSRNSVLALAQTDLVISLLRPHYPTHTFQIHSMATAGDKNQTTALHAFGAKALWTHELESLLLERKLDLIVHSLKDMPTTLPAGCVLGAVTARDDPRDALVITTAARASHEPGKTYTALESLPAGAIVGTSSVRRAAQIARRYPHLKFADVRGNVPTRLRKLDNEAEGAVQYSCLILAAAGLKRLGKGERITAYLDAESGGMLYAVGQGALGVEIREGDERVKEMMGKIEDEKAARACLAERSLMRTLEGGCSVPVGVETAWVGERLRMRACVVSLDGSEAVDALEEAEVKTKEEAEGFGRRVAAALVRDGAGAILKAINDKKEAEGIAAATDIETAAKDGT